MADAVTSTPGTSARKYDVPRMVQAAMDLSGVKQAWLANLLGVSQMSASRRLRGITPFDTNELVKVATALEIDVEFFFQDPHALLRGGSTSARLSHLVGLPSQRDRRFASPTRTPLLSVVTDDH